MYDAVVALAVCHTVTPAEKERESPKPELRKLEGKKQEKGKDEKRGERTYKASSPDEIALVKFAESVGMTLLQRTLNTITLQTPTGSYLHFEILFLFPFSSELKRMSIVVKERETGRIMFYCKGADSAVCPMLQYNDWVEEEGGNMSRTGLRTLIFGAKELTPEQFATFQMRYRGWIFSLLFLLRFFFSHENLTSGL